MPERKSFVFSGNHFLDLTIYHFGHESCKPLHSFGPAKRNHFLFHYIFSGKGFFHSRSDAGQNNEYSLRAGQGFLIWPDQEFSYWADGKDPWEYVWIEFDGFKAKGFVFEAGLTFNDPVYCVRDVKELNKIKNALLDILNHAERSSLEVMGRFYLFISALIASSSKRKEVSRSNLKEFYTREAIAYIDRHYHENITVQNIAAYCRLDRSYMGKVFKSVMNISLQDFLMRYRISKACDILQTTSHSIGEISAMVGYSNLYNFSRTFRTIMGISPSYWRTANKLR